MLLGCYDPIARDGTSGLSLRATPWLAGPTGTVYGGVLALLLDIVMTAPRAQ
jgi:acyl-coenzyme A thioesterase PaaI-like protein